MYKKNEKMLFLKKIPQLLANVAKLGVTAYVLIFDCARGDVVRDPAAAPGGGGLVTVANNLVPGDPGFAVGALPPAGSFAAYVAESIVAPPAVAGAFIGPPNTWQMRGFAAFVDGGGIVRHVYVSYKRKYIHGNPPVNPVASNDPGAGGALLNYSHNMHTERQLAIAALSDAAITALGGALPVAVVGEPAAPPNVISQGPGVPGALPIPAAPLPAVVNGAAELAGTLHIFTESPPCRPSAPDNGNFSCINYYYALGVMFPNVTFHVYFSAARMNLNNWYIDNVPTAKPALFNEIDALIAGGGMALHFRVRSVLQHFNDGNWRNVVDSDAMHNVVTGLAGNWSILPTGASLLNTVNNNILAVPPGAGKLTIQERDHMFRAIHQAPANVFYHAI